MLNFSGWPFSKLKTFNKKDFGVMKYIALNYETHRMKQNSYFYYILVPNYVIHLLRNAFVRLYRF